MSELKWDELFAAAEQARQKAYAPYSKFMVGAALQLDDGSIVNGCNVENASYGLTVCAERHAIGTAALMGKKPVAVAIVTATEKPTPPCGACRQVLAEHAAASTPVRCRTVAGQELRSSVGELLPLAFSKAWL